MYPTFPFDNSWRQKFLSNCILASTKHTTTNHNVYVTLPSTVFQSINEMIGLQPYSQPHKAGKTVFKHRAY